MIDSLLSWLPASLWLISGAVIILVGHLWLKRISGGPGADSRIPWQLVVTFITLIVVLGFVVAMPIPEGLRIQILSLIGVVLTGVIGLSSTTFVTNAFAGIMLRVMEPFKPGDFIRVGDDFGRVSDRGLLHVEIQTEDRDLTTFPNLYLLTNPLTVIHKTGTIVSANVSLGYDVHHSRVEAALCEAAANAGLEEPFVQIKDLGDFSVVYRIAGFLEEVKPLLTVRSKLRFEMLDALHGANIEIVSPTFMNQRPQPGDSRAMPIPVVKRKSSSTDVPEEVMFEKAEKVEHVEALKAELMEKTAKLNDMKQTGEESVMQANLAQEIALLQQRIADAEVQAEDTPKST